MGRSLALPLSFEAYLNHDDGTENRYELTHGVLVALPPESGINIQIVTFLLSIFIPLVGYKRVRNHNTEIQVRGNPQNRWPDLVILTEPQVQQLRQRSTILLTTEPPLLVVEVVSPGQANRERDYIDKFRQYQDRGIPEYWIINPELQEVWIFERDEAGQYQGKRFYDQGTIESTTFPTLTLTAEDIFKAGM
jgi:Uma2 family endonuclease